VASPRGGGPDNRRLERARHGARFVSTWDKDYSQGRGGMQYNIGRVGGKLKIRGGEIRDTKSVVRRTASMGGPTTWRPENWCNT